VMGDGGGGDGDSVEVLTISSVKGLGDVRIHLPAIPSFWYVSRHVEQFEGVEGSGGFDLYLLLVNHALCQGTIALLRVEGSVAKLQWTSRSRQQIVTGTYVENANRRMGRKGGKHRRESDKGR
jgi:hypothetical protein